MGKSSSPTRTRESTPGNLRELLPALSAELRKIEDRLALAEQRAEQLAGGAR